MKALDLCKSLTASILLAMVFTFISCGSDEGSDGGSPNGSSSSNSQTQISKCPDRDKYYEETLKVKKIVDGHYQDMSTCIIDNTDIYYHPNIVCTGTKTYGEVEFYSNSGLFSDLSSNVVLKFIALPNCATATWSGFYCGPLLITSAPIVDSNPSVYYTDLNIVVTPERCQ
jgi:hypothetical protein